MEGKDWYQIGAFVGGMMLVNVSFFIFLTGKCVANQSSSDIHLPALVGGGKYICGGSDVLAAAAGDVTALLGIDNGCGPGLPARSLSGRSVVPVPVPVPVPPRVLNACVRGVTGGQARGL